MLNLFALIFAASSAGAVQAAPAPATAVAPAVRPLSAVPGIKINYYDIAGTDGRAIAKSLDAILKAPGTNTAAQVYDWSIGASVVKEQVGNVCTIKSAKLALTSNAYLPRLKDEGKVSKDVLDQWKPYAATREKFAAENLWFVVDRLPAIEQSLVGKPCATAQATMDAGVQQLQVQEHAFAAQSAARVAAEQAAAKKAASKMQHQ